MKTTADTIMVGQKFSVRHETELIDVTQLLQAMVSDHYNLVAPGLDDDVKDFHTGKRFSFEVKVGEYADIDYNSDSITIEAFPLVVYTKGVITIHVQHDNVQKCPFCEGTGAQECTCYNCGSEDEETCELCCGTGLLCDGWEDFQQYYDIDLPEIVHYKTIDLRQGELF
jgi:hypothetical protein